MQVIEKRILGWDKGNNQEYDSLKIQITKVKNLGNPLDLGSSFIDDTDLADV